MARRQRGPRAGSALSAVLLGLAAAPLLLVAACQGIDPTPGGEPPTPAENERFVRRRIEDAQAFRVQGRLEPATTQLRMALARDPDSARAHALLARTLRDLGREDEARVHAERAHSLAPSAPPPPDTPLDVPSEGLVFVLQPPDVERHAALGLPGEWPDARVPRHLAKRLGARLPKAAVTETSPASVAEAEAWLAARDPRAVVALQVEEATCRESAKDGPFALVRLEAAAASAGALPSEPVEVRVVEEHPVDGADCLELALSRALEELLRAPPVDAALRAASAPANARWNAFAARTLFPVLDARVAAEIELGRAQLAAGRPGKASRSFRRAGVIDPEDVDAYVALVESERAREATGVAPGALDGDDLGADADEVAALEAELEGERRRRDELLAALRVDELRQRGPSPEEIAVLRVVPLRDSEALGPRLARARTGGGPVEERVLYAPDGSVLARFYFAPGGSEPLLREEDTDESGVPDRFTAYAGGRPSEVWEDRGGTGQANAHLVLDEDGTTRRIEIDMDSDGRPERVFHYAEGRLVGGDADRDGDGVLDRFERFDATGVLVSREEDVDADGVIDVRATFRDGRLVRREILNAEAVELLLGGRAGGSGS